MTDSDGTDQAGHITDVINKRTDQAERITYETNQTEHLHLPVNQNHS